MVEGARVPFVDFRRDGTDQHRLVHQRRVGQLPQPPGELVVDLGVHGGAGREPGPGQQRAHGFEVLSQAGRDALRDLEVAVGALPVAVLLREAGGEQQQFEPLLGAAGVLRPVDRLRRLATCLVPAPGAAQGFDEQRVQGAAGCPGAAFCEPGGGRLGEALREEVLDLAGGDPLPVLLVCVGHDVVGGVAAEVRGEEAGGSRCHVLLGAGQQPFDAGQPAFLHRAGVLVQPQPVVDLLGAVLQSVPGRVVVDGAALDGACERGPVVARQPQHDGADVGAVPHGVGSGRFHQVEAGEFVEEVAGLLGGPDAQSAGLREHVLDDVGGDDAEHQAGVGEPADPLVGDVVEDAVVEDALDEHLVDLAVEVPAPGGQAADQFAHRGGLVAGQYGRPGRQFQAEGVAADPVGQGPCHVRVLDAAGDQEPDGGLGVEVDELEGAGGDRPGGVRDGCAAGDDDPQPRVGLLERGEQGPDPAHHRRAPVLGLLEGVEGDEQRWAALPGRGRHRPYEDVGQPPDEVGLVGRGQCLEFPRGAAAQGRPGGGEPVQLGRPLPFLPLGGGSALALARQRVQLRAVSGVLDAELPGEFGDQGDRLVDREGGPLEVDVAEGEVAFGVVEGVEDELGEQGALADAAGPVDHQRGFPDAPGETRDAPARLSDPGAGVFGGHADVGP
ncbi:hypothetical protein ACQEVX_02755 [Streptomyces syringium]|uniref:hypothetical protein n=1 Tax=Streptomyces syringium TaxID=76729 RepID=UPI003D91D76A